MCKTLTFDCNETGVLTAGSDLYDTILGDADNDEANNAQFYWDHVFYTESPYIVAYFHNDYLPARRRHSAGGGSVRRISGENGGLEWSRDYYPFGETREAGGANENNHYTYEGKVEDPDEQSDFGGKDLETDLWNNWNRHFNDEGRFTQVDPLWSKYPSLSLYVRVANNPLGNVDPDGRFWEFVAISAYFNVMINADLGGGDFGQRFKQGAIWGGVTAFATSEATINFFRDDGGFMNNKALFNKWKIGGNQQAIIDNFGFKDGAYDPSNIGFQKSSSRALTNSQGNTFYGDLAFESYIEFRTASFDEFIHGIQYAQGRFPNTEFFDPITFNKLQREAFIADYQNGGLLGHNKAYSMRLLDSIHIHSEIITTPTKVYYAFDDRWWHFIYRIPRRY